MKKKAFLPQILLLVFLLTSCAASPHNTSKITEKMRAAKSADFRADITASFPEREVEFTLDYHYLRDGDDREVIVAPDEISGIALTISDKDLTLSFDGANLEMGRLDESGLTPVSAIPSLITAWTGGNISEAQKTKIFDKEATLVISRITSGETPLEYRTWFSKDDFLPLYAEIFSDGERVIQCEFERAEINLQ